MQFVDFDFYQTEFGGASPGGGLDLTPMIALCYNGAMGPQGVGFDANGDWDGTGVPGFWPINGDTLGETGILGVDENILPNDPNAPHLGDGSDVTSQTGNFSGGDIYNWDLNTLVGHPALPGFTGNLFGPLFDPDNLTNGDVDNGVATSGGTPPGYYWFYDPQALDANGVPIALGGLNEDVGKSTKIEIRFFAQVMDSYEFTENLTPDGNDTGVDITDNLWNYSFVEGTIIENGIDTDGDGVIDTPDQDGDGIADDDDPDYDPSLDERYVDEGREEVEIQAPRMFKHLVGINGDSIMDGGAYTDVVDNLNGNPATGSDIISSGPGDGNIDDPSIQVGDTITYRLTATMPFGSGEEIRITDFMPLPAFDVNDYTDIVTDNGATVPTTWASDADNPIATLGGVMEWNYGPLHNIPGTVVQDSYGTPPGGNTTSSTNPTGTPPGTMGLVEPVVSFNPGQNSIEWNFGTWTNTNDNDPTNDTVVIDILFTVAANAEPFVDDLNLTNEGLLTVNDTDVEPTDEIGIVQVNLAAPEIQMVKGVIGVSSQSNNQGNGQWDGVHGNFDEFGDGGGGGHFGAQNQSPQDAWRAWGHPNHDVTDPTTTPAVNPFGGANIGNGAWDGGSAITSDVLHDTGTNGIRSEGEQDSWHRAFNSDIRDVDAGDILTFGIVVENVGAGTAHDIVIGDQIVDGEVDNPNRHFGVTSFDNSDFELVGGVATAGLTDAQMIDELNFRVFLGDGTELMYGDDYTVTFTPSGPQFFSLELFDAANSQGFAADGSITNSTNTKGGLDRGRTGGNSSDFADNPTGKNILFIKYDVEVKDAWEIQDRHTNEAILEGFSGYHGGGVIEGGLDDYLDVNEDGVVSKITYTDNNGDGRFVAGDQSTDHEAKYEDAEVRGRSPRINKGFITSDRPETGAGSVAGDQHNVENTWTNGPTAGNNGTNTERFNGGYDATIGEEVIYGLMVHVPEGTAENFRVQDFLPAGLEFVDARIITGAADIGTAAYLHAGAVPGGYSPYSVAELHAMANNVNNSSGIPQWRETPFMMGPAGALDAAYQYGGATPVIGTGPAQGDTGTLTFNFGDLVNLPSGGPNNDTTPGIQDSNTFDGRQDDTFMIEIRARVTNDVAYNPYSNDNGGQDATAGPSGTADWNPAAETANSDGDVRNNDARIRFDQWFEDQWNGNQGDGNENSYTEVNIDIVEPLLNLNKDIVTVSHPEGAIDPNTGLPYATDYASFGELVTYEITIGHLPGSTAGAHNINFHDVLYQNLSASGLPLTDATLENLRITSAPANIFGGAPTTLVLNGAMATTPAPGDGVHYQRVAGENNTEQGAGFAFNTGGFLGDFANNTINLNFDYLELGESITIQYDVMINPATDASTAVNDYDVIGNDIRNEAAITYYSVPEISPLPMPPGMENNPEPRERVDTDAEDLAIITPDLTVTKNDGVQTRTVGELYSYTLTATAKAVHTEARLSGLGEPVGDAFNVKVTDTLPPELNFVSAPGYTAAANPAAPQPGEYVLTNLPGGFTQIEFYMLGPANDGTFPAGYTEVINLNTQVNANLPSGDYQIINNVSIENDLPDPTPEDNQDQDVDVLSARPDLFILKNNGVQERTQGEVYDYVLDFGNQLLHDDGVTPTGGSVNTVITDILPPELTFNSLTVTVDGVSISVVPTITTLPNGATSISFNVGDLEPGSVGQVIMNVTAKTDILQGGVSADILNKVSIDNDFDEPDETDNQDQDVDIVRAPDLFITKNDGVQVRETGEVYDYTLNFGAQELHDDGVTPTGIAQNTVITDILPPELIYNSVTVTVNGSVITVTPVITTLSDGSTMVVINVGTLNPGDIGQVVMNVTVNPDLPGGEYEIVNLVSIGTTDAEPDLTDNDDFDIDTLEVNPFFGGSNILQGFRLLDTGFDEESEDEDGPILTLMPIYSGLVDPGTVLRIRILGDTGAPLPNGDQTVVADVGGNWLATFPGLVLMDEPHMVVIEQTPPTWNLGNDSHGYNLRTYFAPAISPTHAQVEEMGAGDVLARRLSGVEVHGMSSQDGNTKSHENSDWRLANHEFHCQSGIGGVLQN